MDKQARITLEVELNNLQHQVKCENNTLQAWLLVNAVCVRQGLEPTATAKAIAHQTGVVQKLNGRITELTMQLANA